MVKITSMSDRGILFFPVTPFDARSELDLGAFEEHLRDRLAYRPAAVFAACGTGEFHSLDLDEFEAVVAAAVAQVASTVPVVAGVGYGTKLGVQFAARAARAGADGLLVFPPPGPISPEGYVQHVRELASSSQLPLIVYQRDNLRLGPAAIQQLLGIGGVVGVKDGLGDMENIQEIVAAAGDRWLMFNGLPTAEVTAPAFSAVGIPRYSSASFSFVPEVAVAFRQALDAGDARLQLTLLTDFFLPLRRLRDSGPGYAVALVKAGARLRGEAVGSVRSPLTDVTAPHEQELARIIERGLAIVR